MDRTQQLEELYRMLATARIEVKPYPPTFMDDHYALLWIENGKGTLQISPQARDNFALEQTILAITVTALISGLAVSETLKNIDVVMPYTYSAYKFDALNTKPAPPGTRRIDWKLLMLAAKNPDIGERLVDVYA